MMEKSPNAIFRRMKNGGCKWEGTKVNKTAGTEWMSERERRIERWAGGRLWRNRLSVNESQLQIRWSGHSFGWTRPPAAICRRCLSYIYQHMMITHVAAATAIMQTNLRTYTQKMTVYPYGPFSSNESTSQAHPVDWKLIKLFASSSNFRIKKMNYQK